MFSYLFSLLPAILAPLSHQLSVFKGFGAARGDIPQEEEKENLHFFQHVPCWKMRYRPIFPQYLHGNALTGIIAIIYI
jgi:hypothetical protein